MRAMQARVKKLNERITLEEYIKEQHKKFNLDIKVQKETATSTSQSYLQTLIADKTKGFVGREFVFAAIENFLK